MKVTILPRAEKELRRIHKLDQLAIAKKIRMLPDPSLTGEEKLSGYTRVFRVRVGNYRIVYKKTSEELTIILIANRKDVYRMLASRIG